MTTPATRPDGCPGCLTRGHVPHETRPQGAGTLAAYRCGLCGHAWLTAWRDQ